MDYIDYTWNEKPPEILELEKVYGIFFNEERYDKKVVHYKDIGYTRNEEGQLNGITLRRKNITNIAPINIIKDLEFIDLSGNSIEDISPLSQHTNLITLNIGENNITDISSLHLNINLVNLFLSNNPFNDSQALKGLTKLQELFCSNTHCRELSFITELKSIELLDLRGNNISNIEPLKNLIMLKVLLLSFNQINDISVLENLEYLKKIDLSVNPIKEIPKKFAEKFRWLETAYVSFYGASDLTIQNVPLEFPPNSVIELGPETVQNYYEMSEQFGHAPLSEGRIIVIGDGSAGKSSLIERVLYNTYDKDKSQTNGIKIEHLHLPHPEDYRDLTFHIWDFGGQEIQHAVHKFFFTEGCLYVLVLDNRKEEEPEYWLQQIESLGGKAPVLVVFNKQDDNACEIADRKFLKEKYPNIVGFYNTSCKTGFGIPDFKKDLEKQVVKLRTVDEQFPNNWFAIKKAIEERTSGEQHYLNYDSYREICKQNNAESEDTQKLLLRYFTTIGAITWFGDTYLNFLHVFSPQWITQGVYKIITAGKTARLFGQINISDFKELLQPIAPGDYTYDEKHYGYILSMMKKFDLCYTPDDHQLLIPSAFGKEPKVEYSDYRGDDVRTYILQFKDYMPPALIHRFIAKNLPDVFDNNYWYSGIVINDKERMSNSQAMVHADKEAKRIYVRIKDGAPLEMWAHIRREFYDISSSYANINYSELVALDGNVESTVAYEDLVSHIKANEAVYFNPKQQKKYNVGYLMGFFESKENTIEKFENREFRGSHVETQEIEKQKLIAINILNQNSATVNSSISNQITIDIDIQVVNEMSSKVRGDADYLLEEIGDKDKELSEALKKIMQFADDAKAAKNSGEVISKGWGRKLKNVATTIADKSKHIYYIHGVEEAVKSMCSGIHDLCMQCNLGDIVKTMEEIIKNL